MQCNKLIPIFENYIAYQWIEDYNNYINHIKQVWENTKFELLIEPFGPIPKYIKNYNIIYKNSFYHILAKFIYEKIQNVQNLNDKGEDLIEILKSYISDESFFELTEQYASENPTLKKEIWLQEFEYRIIIATHIKSFEKIDKNKSGEFVFDGNNILKWIN